MLTWMFMPYRRYAEFSGRSRRAEYWSFMLFYTLVNVALHVVFGHSQTASGPGWSSTQVRELTGVPSAISSLFALGSFIPYLAVSARRLHDQDRSAWLLLLYLVPILGWFALLVFYLLEGTKGANQYGPDPKNPHDIDAFT